jgi:PmbA protein
LSEPATPGRSSGGADGLEEHAALAVEVALAAGADQAEAYGEESSELELRLYDGAVESLSDAGGRGLGVRAFVDGRTGYAYGTELSAAGVKALADSALAAAVAADPDEHDGLPSMCDSARVEGLHSPELGRWDTERKIGLALEIERAARSQAGVSQVEETVYGDAAGRVALANSTGFRGAYESTACWAYASAFAGEGAELMTGLGLGLARDPAGLDPAAIGSEAGRRAAALGGARQVAGRRCPVVLDAFVAASFLGFIGAMLSAESAQRGRSLFAEREGDEIASGELRLIDDRLAADGPASAPFDGEGSPARRTELIADGRLETFLFDARTARIAGRETTSSARRASYRQPPSVGAGNLVLEPGEGDLDELFRQAGSGLYVTHVAGLHSGVNPVSGTFSVGATGRLIEGGEAAAPVREMTIASDLVSMLRGVRAVSSEARWVPFGGSVRASALLLDEMTVAGA